MRTGDHLHIPDSLRAQVLSSKSLAVWPIDENPLSDSYQIARYFQDLGWRIYPVHDSCDRLLEEPCYRDIRLIPDDYDILLLFPEPLHLPEVVNAIFSADFVPPIVWTHTGIFDQESFDRLTEAGILTVMDRNLMQEHRKWAEK